MKKIVATLIVLASMTSMAKTFEVCVIGEDGVERSCRTVTDNRVLGVPYNAVPEQQGAGELYPAPATVYSNGTNGKLYKAIDAFFKALGSTGPAELGTPGNPEAP